MGKEARARRLRKAVTGADKATYTFHITDREQWALALHLTQSTTQKDHGSVERLSRCVEEFGLSDHFDMLTVKDARIAMADFDAVAYEVVSPARDTVDFVLDMTNREMMTLHAIVLGPLVRRLKQVQAGTYQLPKDEGAGAQPEGQADRPGAH
jgi:hypothetical protein